MLNPALCGLVSLATTAFGNSLEPIPALALVQPLALLLAFRGVSAGPRRFWATSLLAALHAGAWTVAFGGLFSFNGWSASGLLTVFALGLLLWVPLCFAAFLGSCFFRTRYPRSPLGALAFPCAWTAIYIVISLTPLSTMANPGYALLDLRPFALAASLCGIHGLNFVCAVSASALEGLICSSGSSSSNEGIDRPDASIKAPAQRSASWVGAAVFALACYGSAWGHLDTFYQRSIEETASKNVIGVSCVLSPGNRPGMETGGMEDWMMAETKERVMAGDEIILWSEASVSVSNSTDEERLLRRAASALLPQHRHRGGVATSTSNGSGHSSSEGISSSEGSVGPYLGVAYFQAEEKRNMFVLLGPSGDPVWRYQKAHPVPFQMDGKPGVSSSWSRWW